MCAEAGGRQRKGLIWTCGVFSPSWKYMLRSELWEVDSGGGEGALPLRVPSPFLPEAPWDPAWPLGPALVLSPAGLAQSRVGGGGWLAPAVPAPVLLVK